MLEENRKARKMAALERGSQDCRRCGVSKPLEAFWKSSTIVGFRTYCKKCDAEQFKDWSQRNHPKRKAYKNQWRAQNPEREREHLRKSRCKRYGISPEEHDKLRAEARSGACLICSQRQRGKRLALDHDHATGAIRGLLCSLCNAGIGCFRDKPALLRKAADYLEQH